MNIGARLVQLLIGLIALFILLLIAAQVHLVRFPEPYDIGSPPDLRQTPGWLAKFRLRVLEADAPACSARLAEAGLEHTLLPPTDSSRQCHLENTVMTQRFSSASLKPEQTRCSIAARLYMWERFVVQPAARAHFHESVKEITHFGSYNCRTIHNSSHMSEHATANAFDISGFVLKSGMAITVKRNWATSGEQQAFLHEVRDGLCQYFNLTLSPDYNTDHADHFHVDMGWVKDCR